MNARYQRPIMIVAGGTGGHIYPALAVAECLIERGVSLRWLGTPTGLESGIIPQRGITLLTIDAKGVRGRGIVRWLTAPFTLVFSILQTLLILRVQRPAMVLGMGGFTSAPGGIAAWLMRIPLCIHEQNAIAGLSNRLLSRLAKTVVTAFPNTFDDASKNVRLMGNPVRKAIAGVTPPSERWRSRPGEPLNILVVGGSLGARFLNTLVPTALALIGDEINYRIKHQSGARNVRETRRDYEKHAIAVDLMAYIEDMSAAYAWADLMICRAGAITVAEITAVGVAAIFIPYPYAVDDHQTANARYLSDAGAALLLQESELDAARLAALLRELAADRERLFHMATTARSLSKPDAATRVADLCMEMAYA